MSLLVAVCAGEVQGFETQGLRCPSEMTDHAVFDYGADAIGSPTITAALDRWRGEDDLWEMRPEWATLTAQAPMRNIVSFVNDEGWVQLRVEFTDFLGTGWLVSEYASCATMK